MSRHLISGSTYNQAEVLYTAHEGLNETLHVFQSIGPCVCLKAYISVSDTSTNSQRSLSKGLYGHLGRNFRVFLPDDW